MSDQPAPFGATNPAALVGRGRDETALRERLAAALAGRGGLVLIGGEAGIGKTTLAEVALTEAATRGAAGLVGRCYDLSETPPYGPGPEPGAAAPLPGLPSIPPGLAPAEASGSSVPMTSQETIFAQV